MSGLYHAWCRNLIPAVPYCHLTFLAVRPPLRRYERVRVPEGTLGADFRARRWNRGLEQREAAAEIGVALATYRGWETNRRQPGLRHIPAIIRFLGFDWREPGTSLGDRIRRCRTAAAMSECGSAPKTPKASHTPGKTEGEKREVEDALKKR